MNEDLSFMMVWIEIEDISSTKRSNIAPFYFYKVCDNSEHHRQDQTV